MLKLSHTLSVLAMTMAFGANVFAAEMDGTHVKDGLGEEITHSTDDAYRAKDARETTIQQNRQDVSNLHIASMDHQIKVLPTVLQTSRLFDANGVNKSILTQDVIQKLNMVKERINLVSKIVPELEADFTKNGKKITVGDQKSAGIIALFVEPFSASELADINADHFKSNIENYANVFGDADDSEQALDHYARVLLAARNAKLQHPEYSVQQSLDAGVVRYAEDTGMSEVAATDLDKKLDDNQCLK